MGAKAKHDIAPMIRHAFLKGIGLHARKQRMTIPELMESWIDEDWKAVLTMLGKFTVKEQAVRGTIEHSHQHKHTHVAVSEIDSWLEGIVEQQEDSDAKALSSH